MRTRLIFLALMPVWLCGLTAFAGNGMYLEEISGYVVYSRDNYVEIEDEAYYGEANIVGINTGAAVVYDLLTGYPAKAEALREGMTVRASYDNAFYADTVWLNCGEPNAAAFAVEVSENIYYGLEESVFVSGDGKYRVTLSPSTPVIDPYAGTVSPTDIYPGQQMFVWVDMVTASFPAEVFPEKVVLIY